MRIGFRSGRRNPITRNWFGTGPIRGFAVVLMIGIVTSVFTAVTLTRMWVSQWLHKTRPSDIVL
jgi:preprotein translocase subunit SecD